MHNARTLAADLRRLGLAEGDTVLVHSSLHSVGAVEGGAAAVVSALRAVTGSAGTLVVPAFTDENSLSSRAHRARVRGMTPKQAAAYRATMEPFDPLTSPGQRTGRISESLRTTPGALRSFHPQTSFAALGARAVRIIAGHADDCHLGDASPLGRLYEAHARVLLLGVGFEACSALHLAECRVPEPPMRDYACVVATEEGARWRHFRDVDLVDRDFPELGAALENLTHRGRALVAHGRVGAAYSRLLPMVPTVDAAVEWLAEHRPRSASSVRPSQEWDDG